MQQWWDSSKTDRTLLQTLGHKLELARCTGTVRTTWRTSNHHHIHQRSSTLQIITQSNKVFKPDLWKNKSTIIFFLLTSQARMTIYPGAPIQKYVVSDRIILRPKSVPKYEIVWAFTSDLIVYILRRIALESHKMLRFHVVYYFFPWYPRPSQLLLGASCFGQRASLVGIIATRSLAYLTIIVLWKDKTWTCSSYLEQSCSIRMLHIGIITKTNQWLPLGCKP